MAPRSSRCLLGLIAVLCVPACGGGSAATSASTATGRLNLTGCAILENAAACQASIGWTTGGAAAPRVVLDGATLSTASTGQTSISIGIAVRTVALFDGNAKLDEGTLRAPCVSASAWTGRECRAFARRFDERAPTPFVEGGRPVSLEVVLFEPLGVGPFPAVTFHHGSTGNGTDPSLFTLTSTNETIAQFFTERGYIVAFPQRRGRGKSDGLYDEGFTPDRSSYSCLQGPALAGFDHALQDVDVAVDYVKARSAVDPRRLLSAGASRGGVLAVAHAGLRPGLFAGAVNFVGGWLGEGCVDAVAVNRSAFVRGARFDGPTAWLYAENDSFYSLAHSRANFSAFLAAGGQGIFLTYTRAPTLNGHFLLSDPALWTADLDAFVKLVER